MADPVGGDTTNFSEETFENSEEKYLVNSANFETDNDLRWKFKNLIQTMIDQEGDKCEKEKMRDVINHLKWCPLRPSSRDLCRKKIGEWVTDRLPKPPPVESIEFEKANGKLIATWIAPQWPFPLWYSGIVQSGGEKSVVEQFQDIKETSYKLSIVSPFCGYYVTVWAVDQKGQRGQETQSSEEMLFEKYKGIFVDTTSRLRTGYEVYKGYMGTASNLAEVAVKVVSGKVGPEVEILQKLKHRNIVTYIGSETMTEACGGLYCIAMELCSADTFQELVNDKRLNMQWCKISLLHMMLGLDAIHKAGFIHGDLKPGNILRSLDGKNMKIAGFGLCAEMDPDKSRYTKSVIELGTEGWGSPEHYRGEKMSIKSDIYSGGLVSAFGLSHGKHVYGSELYEWIHRIMDGRDVNLSILACVNAEIAKDMILKMLERDPDKRPTATQVLAHPFFWGDDKKLNFLQQMHSFFTPVVLRKNIVPEKRTAVVKVAPQQQTMTVMQDLDTKTSIFQTKDGEANWVKKMEETPEVAERYKHVLLSAKGLVPPRLKYDPTSVFHLLRFIRNVGVHHGDKKEFLKEFYDNRSNVWKLFYKCYPTLFCTVYNVVYKHFPQIVNCSDFPIDADKFFTEPAQYEPLPIPGTVCNPDFTDTTYTFLCEAK